MWNRLGHFVPSRQTGGGREQKRSFYLKKTLKGCCCVLSDRLWGPTLCPHRAHAGETGRRGGRPAGAPWQEAGTHSKALGHWGCWEARPLEPGPTGRREHWEVAGLCTSGGLRHPPFCSPPLHLLRAFQISSLFLGCHAHHREARVNGNTSEDEQLLRSGGNVVCDLSV